MRFAALGSGSKGNAWVVALDDTAILIDCGFGPRETARRLQRLGMRCDQIAAIFVTHEHTDHIGGAAACHARYGWPKYMTEGTRGEANATHSEGRLRGGEPQEIGALTVHPVTVPHDAREPVQFVVEGKGFRLGILTDAGHVTPHMVASFGGCDALVLECNHEAQLLASGRYPQALKRRIAGGYGHLANHVAASMLAETDVSRLRYLVAAHLSEENNAPHLARAALAQVLDCNAGWIAVADQALGLDWREL
jgi:phosphoribosyl 1,2-cyclic phosphodiesterase